ncbi:IS110 family transposase [Luteococcus sediminum]
MTMMTNPGDHVAGIDSHKDTIHIAVITATGLEVADHEFATTTVGYRRAVAWLANHGPVAAVGIEGTSSYGVGITAALRRNGIQVVEVNRTRPADRRKQGKTDRLDAYRAARCVLSGEATTHPKHDTIEPLRALVITRRGATKSLQACWRQIGSLLVNASPALRDKYRETGRDKLVDLLAASRPDQVHNLADATTLRALRSLARRHLFLRAEIDDLDTQLDTHTTAKNPGLRAIHGIGPALAAVLLTTAGDNPDRLRSPASFAALCGTSPIPVSSGKTQRHRLSRGGDRQANWALHQAIKVRMSHDQRTRGYRDKHLDAGWTLAAVYRSLKRALVREVVRALTGHCQIPNYTDLRPTRQAKNLTLTTAAQHFNVWPARISDLELGKRRDDTLAHNYREWLKAA